MPGKAPGHRHLMLCVVIAATAHEQQHTCDPQKITACSQLMQCFRSQQFPKGSLASGTVGGSDRAGLYL